MKLLKTLSIAFCLVLLGAAFLPTQSRADEWNKKTVITISAPLAVPGKVLPPGTYVLKLQDSPADRHIVQIFNEDESQIQATVLAIPNYRLEPSDKTQLAYWEMPAGQPRALKAWFYPGDNFGQEFAYPKELATTIAQANNASVPTVGDNNQVAMTAPSGKTQATVTQPALAPAPEQPATGNENNAGTMAENQQPAAPPSAETQPQPAQPSPAPATNENAATNMGSAGRALPRTASPFPLMGLAGLLSVGAAFVSRAIARRA